MFALPPGVHDSDLLPDRTAIYCVGMPGAKTGYCRKQDAAVTHATQPHALSGTAGRAKLRRLFPGAPMKCHNWKAELQKRGGNMRYFLALCSGFALCLFMSVGVTSAAPIPTPGHPPWARGDQGHGHGNQGHADEHGNGHGEHGRGHHEDRRESRPAFSYHDRDLIQNYFRRYRSSLPPGLAKRGGNLPPGLERQLQERGTLPPGLEKRLRPFPVRLSRELPPLPRGYRRVLLGPRALIISSNNVVIAIMNIPL